MKARSGHQRGTSQPWEQSGPGVTAFWSHAARAARIAVVAVLIAASAHADTVNEWNAIWLDCVRATGGPPCPVSRAGAMVHAAIYDAVNCIDRSHEPYLIRRRAPRDASPEAAAAQAAHDVLAHLYPGRLAILDAALQKSLGAVPEGRSKVLGVAVGRMAARNLIHARADDGSGDATPYPIGTAPGEWRPTFPDYTAPFTPNWGSVKPWVLASGGQFRPAGPLGIMDIPGVLASPGYVIQFDEVKALGARASTTRTPYETETAYFWANDVDGTFKPPGHLNHIAQVLADQEGLTLTERARLFALLNIALADAAIVAWDCKYLTPVDLWRPITGIREADTDGNPLTAPDPTWEPLNAFTPPFPAYISGHATFAAAAAAVFARFFGTDEITHTIGTDEPLYTGGPRTYQRFSEAARENAESRIFLGVHWRFDAEDGLAAGTAVGNYVYDHILGPVATSSVITADAMRSEGTPPQRSAEATAGALSVQIAPVSAGLPLVVEIAAASPGHVRALVVDVSGRLVARLADGSGVAGLSRVTWDGRSLWGDRLASGVYFLAVETDETRVTRKFVVVQ